MLPDLAIEALKIQLPISGSKIDQSESLSDAITTNGLSDRAFCVANKTRLRFRQLTVVFYR